MKLPLRRRTVNRVATLSFTGLAKREEVPWGIQPPALFRHPQCRQVRGRALGIDGVMDCTTALSGCGVRVNASTTHGRRRGALHPRTCASAGLLLLRCPFGAAQYPRSANRLARQDGQVTPSARAPGSRQNRRKSTRIRLERLAEGKRGVPLFLFFDEMCSTKSR